jgi:pimeloyl-ACP methyl ester carboxylesterase
MWFLGERGYRCIAHDRRGHGRSSQPWNGNDMDTYADDLATLVETLDLKNAILVGHSMGGGEVARYIGRHGTKRVAKAVFISAILAACTLFATSASAQSAEDIRGPSPLVAIENEAAAEADAVRPFRINVPEAALVDLRRRVAATRWPDRETVTDQSQGVPLAKIQELVCYWGTDYDWRKVEAKLNAWPQFVTEIDGLDIHFVHVRSRHPHALPLIMTHGWPGSIVELLKVIGGGSRGR